VRSVCCPRRRSPCPRRQQCNDHRQACGRTCGSAAGCARGARRVCPPALPRTGTSCVRVPTGTGYQVLVVGLEESGWALLMRRPWSLDAAPSSSRLSKATSTTTFDRAQCPAGILGWAFRRCSVTRVLFADDQLSESRLPLKTLLSRSPLVFGLPSRTASLKALRCPIVLDGSSRACWTDSIKWVSAQGLVHGPAERTRFVPADFGWFASVVYPTTQSSGLGVVAAGGPGYSYGRSARRHGRRPQPTTGEARGRRHAQSVAEPEFDIDTGRLDQPAEATALADLWRRTAPLGPRRGAHGS
jgi:hypothetical protein